MPALYSKELRILKVIGPEGCKKEDEPKGSATRLVQATAKLSNKVDCNL